MWGISCTSYLSALGSQAHTVLFSTDTSFLLKFDPFLGSLWILSHIGKKCTPRMPYKLLGKGIVYHYHDVGQNPKAFQKWVEPEEETHVGWEQNRAGLPSQSRQIAYAENLPHIFYLLWMILMNFKKKLYIICN